jgi:hypothetical protein
MKNFNLQRRQKFQLGNFDGESPAELRIRLLSCRPKHEAKILESFLDRFPWVLDYSNPGRVTRDMCESIKTAGFLPVVSVTDGQEFSLDAAGIVHSGRYWPPILFSFDHELEIADRFFGLVVAMEGIAKRSTMSSYELKHMFEATLGYVSNGACILSAFRHGLPLRYAGDLNVELPINAKFLKWFESRSNEFQTGLVLGPRVRELMQELRKLLHMEEQRRAGEPANGTHSETIEV